MNWTSASTRRHNRGNRMNWTPEEIEALLKSKRINARKLADLTGLTVQSISDWRRGKTSPGTGSRFLLHWVAGLSADQINDKLQYKESNNG